jgi:hypothetical protein
VKRKFRRATAKGRISPLDAPAVDLEAPVGEPAPKEFALIERVSRRAPERGLLASSVA